MPRTKFQVISAASASLYPSADCLMEGCDWSYPPSPNARAEAKAHAGETGHSTRTEQVNRAVYQGVPR